MSDSVRPHRRQPTRLPHPWDSPGKNTGVGCHFLLQCMKVKSQSEVAPSCPTPSDPMDCSPPGSSVHGIFQARVLEWGAIAFSSHLGNLKLMSAASAMRSEKKKKRIDLGKFRKFWIKLSYINKWLKAVREFIKVTAHKIHTKISTAILSISWNILKTKRRHYESYNCQKKFKPPIKKILNIYKETIL